MKDSVAVHKFQMGVAPYRHAGFWCPPSRAMLETNPNAYNTAMNMRPACCHFSCGHCGTSIVNHHIIKDSAGKAFVVGSSCIDKLHDVRLSTVAKEAVNKRNREIAAAKRDAKLEQQRAAVEAELERQKEVNGGLTDWEMKRETARQVEQAQRNNRAEIFADLIHAAALSGSDFARDIILSLVRGDSVSERGLIIFCEIIAKNSGRKNSKSYNAALPKIQAGVDRMIKEAQAI